MKYTINVKAKVITDPPNNQTNPSKTLLFIITTSLYFYQGGQFKQPYNQFKSPQLYFNNMFINI